MKMPVWFWLLVVIGAVLVGRALGWGAGHAAAANATAAPPSRANAFDQFDPPAAPVQRRIVDPFDPPAPPPGFVLDKPLKPLPPDAVLDPVAPDTAQVDRMNAAARHDEQVRQDAQIIADELEARRRARGTP